MHLIAAIPLITTPVRLGLPTLSVLAGHPRTKLAGFAVVQQGQTAPSWLTISAMSSILASSGGATVVMPGVDLVKRLGASLPDSVIHAEDLCRLWGEPTWHPQSPDMIASVASPESVRRVTALCRDLHQRMMLIEDLLTPLELSAYRSHRAINARGIHLELNLARWLQDVLHARDRHRTATLGASFQRSTLTVTEALAPNGPIDRLLRAHGLTLKNRSEDALLDILDSNPDDPVLTAVLRELIGHGRIVKTKLQRMLADVGPGDRLRNQFVMWAARTWRFSSHGTQVQNTPKPLEGINQFALASVALDQLRDPQLVVQDKELQAISHVAPGHCVDDAAPAYLRMCFSASDGHDLMVLDWNAIEPRIRAWLSDDQEHLAAWRNGRDLYSELIGGIVGYAVTKATHPHLRNVGKVADIGCGYHMGADSFAKLCAANGVNLDHLDLKAKQVVDTYRRKYHAIAHPRTGLWTLLQDATVKAVICGDGAAGHLRFVKHGKHLDMILPNGSRRRWWNAIVEMRSPPWVEPGDTSQDRPVVIVASTPDGTSDQVMYGGRILENACQAIGREILIEFMIDAPGIGAPVVAHCHDEVVAEIPVLEAPAVLVRMRARAETSPLWAPDLPLRAEAFLSPFWAKNDPFG